MKNIAFFLTLAALLLANLIQAQTDSVNEKKPMIIDGKKIRITIDTKDKEHQTKTSKLIYNGDTTILESEEPITKSEGDEEKKVIREEKIVIKEKKKTKPKRDSDDDKDESKNPSNWFSMDYGFNFLTSNGTLDMPEAYKDLELDNGKGCNFNLRIYEQSISIVPKHMYLVYGVGMDWNNYRFKSNVDLQKDSNVLSYIINNNNDYRKNKLVSTYLTAPVMLKFKFNENKRGEAFKIAVGPQFGYLLNSHTKQKWENDGEKHKQKIRGDYNFDEFRIGYAVYMGYGDIDFYARYYPESAFKENKGPDVNTVCIGLSFGGF